jgi:DNA-binding beta-propeller fold protein YncE
MTPAKALLPFLLLATPLAADTLVVANKAEATVSLIDLASGEVAATLPTATGPHEVGVSPDGSLALVTNYGNREEPGSSLTLIDVGAAVVVRTLGLPEGSRPHGVAWLDGGRVAVTCEGLGALLVVDTATSWRGSRRDRRSPTWSPSHRTAAGRSSPTSAPAPSRFSTSRSGRW